MSHKIINSDIYGRLRINFEEETSQVFSVESLDSEFEDFEIVGITVEETLPIVDFLIQRNGF